MGTTGKGIRYPEPADPVRDGAQAMHNLADDVTWHLTTNDQYHKPVGGYGSPLIGTNVSGAARFVTGRFAGTTDASGFVVLNWGPQGYGAIYGVCAHGVDQGGLVYSMRTGGLTGDQAVIEIRNSTNGTAVANSFVNFCFLVFGA
jgi:hypothetical protein